MVEGYYGSWLGVAMKDVLSFAKEGPDYWADQ